jgi:hypothetical protein
VLFKGSQKEVLTVRDLQYNIGCSWGKTTPLFVAVEGLRKSAWVAPGGWLKEQGKEFLVKGQNSRILRYFNIGLSSP